MNLTKIKNIKRNDRRSKKGLWWSLACLLAFTGLMFFGLKQNAGFTPSALVGKRVPYFEAELFPIGKFRSDSIAQHETWTVVNFWSSTCFVCKKEAQEFQNFYQNVSLLNAQTPKFVSVNIQEDFQTIANWQRDYAQNFPVVMDKTGHISILFGVTGTPETFLIDTHGIVRYRIAGEVNTNFILGFINWFESNPQASEKQARTQFMETP